jgi:hypothetical protein
MADGMASAILVAMVIDHVAMIVVDGTETARRRHGDGRAAADRGRPRLGARCAPAGGHAALERPAPAAGRSGVLGDRGSSHGAAIRRWPADAGLRGGGLGGARGCLLGRSSWVTSRRSPGVSGSRFSTPRFCVVTEPGRVLCDFGAAPIGTAHPEHMFLELRQRLAWSVMVFAVRCCMAPDCLTRVGAWSGSAMVTRAGGSGRGEHRDHRGRACPIPEV